MNQMLKEEFERIRKMPYLKDISWDEGALRVSMFGGRTLTFFYQEKFSLMFLYQFNDFVPKEIRRDIVRFVYLLAKEKKLRSLVYLDFWNRFYEEKIFESFGFKKIVKEDRQKLWEVYSITSPRSKYSIYQLRYFMDIETNGFKSFVDKITFGEKMITNYIKKRSDIVELDKSHWLSSYSFDQTKVIYKKSFYFKGLEEVIAYNLDGEKPKIHFYQTKKEYDWDFGRPKKILDHAFNDIAKAQRISNLFEPPNKGLERFKKELFGSHLNEKEKKLNEVLLSHLKKNSDLITLDEALMKAKSFYFYRFYNDCLVFVPGYDRFVVFNDEGVVRVFNKDKFEDAKCVFINEQVERQKRIWSKKIKSPF